MNEDIFVRAEFLCAAPFLGRGISGGNNLLHFPQIIVEQHKQEQRKKNSAEPLLLIGHMMRSALGLSYSTFASIAASIACSQSVHSIVEIERC